MSFEVLSYKDAIDFLRQSYRRGSLVPFIGSGLSARAMPNWTNLVKGLASLNPDFAPTLPKNPTDRDLIVASERTVAGLRANGQSIGRAVRTVLGTGGPTRATKALAAAWWPLVLTTNYDRMFLDAFNAAWYSGKRSRLDAMGAVGRSRADCQTLLASLSVPTRPLLWALQGFFGTSVNDVDLVKEIVLGYEQYREATFNYPGFRAAFIELFRTRSFLFVGSGLNEDYFRGLFGESLVRLGAGHQSHCALVNARELDRRGLDDWFFHTRLNIVVLTYTDESKQPYSGFVPAIEKICKSLRDCGRQTDRVFISTHGIRSESARHTTVTYGPSPLPKPDGARNHWVVVSAGRDRHTRIPKPSRDARRLKLRQYKWVRVGPSAKSGALWRADGEPILLVVARQHAGDVGSGRARDLRHVARVTSRALHEAVRAGASRVTIMLIAASVEHRRWPRVFSLVQMVRGIRTFLLESKSAESLDISIVDTAAADNRNARYDASVWHAVQSGRLDVHEVIGCEAIRFFVEVVLDDVVRRTPIYLREDVRIRDVADYFVVAHDWVVRLEPSPTEDGATIFAGSEETIADVGVVPGSTIRFTPRASGASTVAR